MAGGTLPPPSHVRKANRVIMRRGLSRLDRQKTRHHLPHRSLGFTPGQPAISPQYLPDVDVREDSQLRQSPPTRRARSRQPGSESALDPFEMQVSTPVGDLSNQGDGGLLRKQVHRPVAPLLVMLDQVRDSAVQVPDPRLIPLLPHALLSGLCDRSHQRLLGPVSMDPRRGTNPGRRRDVLEAHLRIRLLAKEALGGLENAFFGIRLRVRTDGHSVATLLRYYHFMKLYFTNVGRQHAFEKGQVVFAPRVRSASLTSPARGAKGRCREVAPEADRRCGDPR